MKKAELMVVKKNGNALTKKVINVILDRGNVEEMESFMKDVLNHGCVSGLVGELIYYTDTTAFYKKYKKEINELLRETLSDSGIKSPAELFGNKWEDEDIFAEETHNQNLLAWFGFEEAVRNVLSQLDIEY